jgi:uncharacterized protein YbjT (DUF2867 family)
VKRVLVTGAAGHAGGMVLSALEAQGQPVRAAGTRVERLQRPGREVVRLDFTDPASWGAALAGCDGLFLMRPPPLADMEHTLCPFLDAARAAGVAHVVFLSVAGAERMRWVPHRAVEQHLEAGPGGWTILRPGFFAQNLEEAYARDLKEDGRLYVPAGGAHVAFLDVLDVGAVTARVLAEPARFEAQHLTLTGPAAPTLAEVAACLSLALGRPIRYQPATLAGYVWHLKVRRGLPWIQVLVQCILHLGVRRGDAEVVAGTVQAVLGREASSLSAYLARRPPALFGPEAKA